MALLKFRRRETRRRWVFITTGTALAAAMLLIVAAATANLTGSNFESTDGNLVVDGASPAEDWANTITSANIAAGTATVQTDLTKSTSDNAFGQGAKEDIPNPTVVFGSIPPNKSDLSRFYTFTETGTNSHKFLYLAWERTNVLGSANMDFELNQSATLGSNNTTPVRTAGDLLFTYDFTNGGSKPTLGMLTWQTAAAGDTASECFSSNSLPCWGDRVDLSAAGVADGSINTVSVTDPINPGAPRTLAANTFGETAIDLTLALPDVFGPNPTKCESFGSAYLKSRSSASFTAELKDFIAPVGISVSNCGYVLVEKFAEDSGLPQNGATFIIEPGQTDANGNTNTSDTIPAVAGHDGFYCIDNLLLSASYKVTETAAPPGYDIPNPDNVSGLSATAGTCGDVDYSSPPTPTVTFTDPAQKGAIEITKVAKNKTAGSPQPLQGAVFTVNGVQHTTDANGKACWSDLPFGDYTVHEDSAPAGYAAAADVTVTVNAKGDCTSGAATQTITDVPLTDISVTSTSQVAGATGSKISCVDSDGNTVGTDVTSYTDPASDDANDLEPGVYTCTIDIDP